MTVDALWDAIMTEWSRANPYYRGQSTWHLSPRDFDLLYEDAQEKQRERERQRDETLWGRPYYSRPYPEPPMVRTTGHDMLTGLRVVKDKSAKDGRPELRAPKIGNLA